MLAGFSCLYVGLCKSRAVLCFSQSPAMGVQVGAILDMERHYAGIGMHGIKCCYEFSIFGKRELRVG